MANFEFSTLLETIYNVRYPVAVQLLPKILQFKSKISGTGGAVCKGATPSVEQ